MCVQSSVCERMLCCSWITTWHKRPGDSRNSTIRCQGHCQPASVRLKPYEIMNFYVIGRTQSRWMHRRNPLRTEWQLQHMWIKICLQITLPQRQPLVRQCQRAFNNITKLLILVSIRLRTQQEDLQARSLRWVDVHTHASFAMQNTTIGRSLTSTVWSVS